MKTFCFRFGDRIVQDERQQRQQCRNGRRSTQATELLSHLVVHLVVRLAPPSGPPGPPSVQSGGPQGVLKVPGIILLNFIVLTHTLSKK